jgi:hypothetical protein
MYFSMHTDQHVKDAVDIFGYAYGYTRICKHFGQFKYKNKQMTVLQNSPSAQVQMFYMEPEWYNLNSMQDMRAPDFKKFYNHQYKIYGTHLEATRVWSHWIDSMNQVDEIWVGNQFAADAVVNSDIKTPVYVFEHGIDEMWTKRKKRGTGKKIKFLHVDSGSPRKRADLAEYAFLNLFKNNKNVELTLKFHTHESRNSFGVMEVFRQGSPNIKKIYQTLSQEEMLKLFLDHDVLIYPTEGEGFGFIPLQALSTGMPVISTGRWCSYEKYFKDNIIESTIGPTQYTGYFEGEVVLPELESLMFQMKKVYENIEQQCDFYYEQSPKIYKEYNWQRRCDMMLNSFIKRVGISALDEALGWEVLDKKPILYVGQGRYISISGTIFDKDNRIHVVGIEEYNYLARQKQFRHLTPDEIKINFGKDKNVNIAS